MRPHDPAACDLLVLELAVSGGRVVVVSSVLDVELDSDITDRIAIPAPIDQDDTDPLGFTVIGPLFTPRLPAKTGP
jgi:hypothetical protein